MKPMTYMNLSGDSVYLVKNYYKVEIEDILVIYDDLDLETGKIRIRPNGSSGGHKGIQSIINNLGTKDLVPSFFNTSSLITFPLLSFS